MTEEVMAPEGAENQEAPNLSLQDIATFVQIIDLVSRRGGFEGQELEVVGGVRNRILSFLQAAAPKDELPEGEVPVADEQPSEEDSDA